MLHTATSDIHGYDSNNYDVYGNPQRHDLNCTLLVGEDQGEKLMDANTFATSTLGFVASMYMESSSTPTRYANVLHRQSQLCLPLPNHLTNEQNDLNSSGYSRQQYQKLPKQSASNGALHDDNNYSSNHHCHHSATARAVKFHSSVNYSSDEKKSTQPARSSKSKRHFSSQQTSSSTSASSRHGMMGHRDLKRDSIEDHSEEIPSDLPRRKDRRNSDKYSFSTSASSALTNGHKNPRTVTEGGRDGEVSGHRKYKHYSNRRHSSGVESKH